MRSPPPKTWLRLAAPLALLHVLSDEPLYVAAHVVLALEVLKDIGIVHTEPDDLLGDVVLEVLHARALLGFGCCHFSSFWFVAIFSLMQQIICSNPYRSFYLAYRSNSHAILVRIGAVLFLSGVADRRISCTSSPKTKRLYQGPS